MTLAAFVHSDFAWALHRAGKLSTLAGRKTRLIPGEANAGRTCGEKQPAHTAKAKTTKRTHGVALHGARRTPSQP